MTVNHSRITLVNDRAKVQFGKRTFMVAGQDAEDSPLCCPVELMVGALGS